MYDTSASTHKKKIAILSVIGYRCNKKKFLLKLPIFSRFHPRLVVLLSLIPLLRNIAPVTPVWEHSLRFLAHCVISPFRVYSIPRRGSFGSWNERTRRVRGVTGRCTRAVWDWFPFASSSSSLTHASFRTFLSIREAACCWFRSFLLSLSLSLSSSLLLGPLFLWWLAVAQRRLYTPATLVLLSGWSQTGPAHPPSSGCCEVTRGHTIVIPLPLFVRESEIHPRLVLTHQHYR